MSKQPEMSDNVNIFDIPRKDVSEISSKIVRFYPKSIISQAGPIEFDLLSDDMIDLKNSKICYLVSIVSDKGAELVELSTKEKGDIVAPVINWLHAITQFCKMTVGEQEMEETFNLYAYTAYFDTILNTTQEDQDTKLSAQMWGKDMLDNLNWTHTEDEMLQMKSKEEGKGTQWDRFNYHMTNRKTGIWMSGRPCCDLFQQDRYIPPNMTIRLSLYQQINPAFWYMSFYDKKYMLKIHDVFMDVRTVKTAPAISRAMEVQLLRKPAKYPIARKITLPFNANKGETSVMIQDPTRGRVPSKLYIGFVDAEAVDGSYEKNPWNFENLGIRSMQFYINGDTFRNAYVSTDKELNYAALFDKGPINLPIEKYLKGTTLYAFYPKTEGKNGIGQLTVSFTAALTKNYRILVYYECDDEVDLQN